MWQSPNQRTQAAQLSKKMQDERLSRPIHLQRVRAEIRLIPPSDVQVHGNATTEHPPGEIRQARVMLNDLSSGGIGIYSPDPMNPGVQVKILLQDPQTITFEGKVIWCRNVQNEGRVLSQQPYPYKIGVKFSFKTPEEATQVKEFCEDLQKNHLYAPKQF